MLIRAALMLTFMSTPVLAHDWYEGKMVPGTKILCCGGYDCRAILDADVRPLPNGDFMYLPDKFEIPQRSVQRSPDGNYHICIVETHPDRHHRSEMTRRWTCFFAPDLSF